MDDEALYNQWMNFSSSDQWERARVVLGEMLAKEPESSWIHYQLASACYELDDHNQSVHHFQEAIKLDPDDSDHYRGLAYTFLAMGRPGRAEDHARVALQLDPDEFANWTLMAHICILFEDKAQAALCVDRAASFAPESTVVLSLRAQVNALGDSGNDHGSKEKLADFEKVLIKDPEHESALYQSGLIHLNETKDYQKAEEFFRRALQQDPEDKSYQSALIRTFRKRDRILRALWAPVKLGGYLIEKNWFWMIAIFCVVFTGQYGVAAIFAFILSYFLVFWPPTKLYEILTLSEAHKQLGTLSVYRGPMGRIHRLSYPVRFAIFSFVIISFWTVLGTMWFSEGTRSPLISWASGILIGAFILLLGLGLGITIWEKTTQSRRARRNRQFMNPPSI